MSQTEIENAEIVDTESVEDENNGTVLPGDSQIITIFGKQYLAESVTPRAHSIVKDMSLVNEEIEKLEKLLRVAQLAKGALLQNYQEEAKSFTEIEVQVHKK